MRERPKRESARGKGWEKWFRNNERLKRENQQEEKLKKEESRNGDRQENLGDSEGKSQWEREMCQEQWETSLINESWRKKERKIGEELKTHV